MAKQKLEYVSDERMAEIDPGEELEIDLLAGTPGLDSQYAERIEYLRHQLWDAMGRLTQYYPSWDEWDAERLKDFATGPLGLGTIAQKSDCSSI